MDTIAAHQHRIRPLLAGSLLVAAGLLNGCASYHALPLARHAGARSVNDVRIDSSKMPSRELAAHRFDPRDGLDVTEVAMLAVANNPRLRLLRDDAGVAHAQAFAAGLLPDPKLSWTQDFVTGNSGGPGATTPFGLGLSWDVGQLLTYSARTHAAKWNERQIDLNLLWAEWQTVTQARLLFSRIHNQRAVVRRLRAEVTALLPLQRQIDAALTAGDISFALASSASSALADARDKLLSARGQLDQSDHGLHLLLGLKPDVPLHLVGHVDNPRPDAAEVRSALAELPRRRPDLLALQAGYRSENEKLREAILRQFPAVSIGFNRARDNAGVYTSGFGISIGLPLFNRNRGNIAIQRATRKRLHDDYSARLLASENDVSRLAAQLNEERATLPAATRHAARLDAALHRARQAWRRRLVDLPTYLSLRSNALKADLQRDALRQATTDTAIALQMLLGTDWSKTAEARLRAGKPQVIDRTQHP